MSSYGELVFCFCGIILFKFIVGYIKVAVGIGGFIKVVMVVN